MENKVIKSILNSLLIQIDGENEKICQKLATSSSEKSLKENIINEPRNKIFLRSLQIKLNSTQ